MHTLPHAHTHPRPHIQTVLTTWANPALKKTFKKNSDYQAPAGQQQYAGADVCGVVRAVPGKLPGVIRGCSQESPRRTQGSQSGPREVGRSGCCWITCPVCTSAAGNSQIHSNAPQGCRSALLAFLRVSR